MNSYLEMLNDTMTVPDDEEVGPSKMDRILALVAKNHVCIKEMAKEQKVLHQKVEYLYSKFRVGPGEDPPLTRFPLRTTKDWDCINALLIMEDSDTPEIRRYVSAELH